MFSIQALTTFVGCVSKCSLFSELPWGYFGQLGSSGLCGVPLVPAIAASYLVTLTSRLFAFVVGALFWGLEFPVAEWFLSVPFTTQKHWLGHLVGGPKGEQDGVLRPTGTKKLSQPCYLFIIVWFLLQCQSFLVTLVFLSSRGAFRPSEDKKHYSWPPIFRKIFVNNIFIVVSASEVDGRTPIQSRKEWAYLGFLLLLGLGFRNTKFESPSSVEKEMQDTLMLWFFFVVLGTNLSSSDHLSETFLDCLLHHL